MGPSPGTPCHWPCPLALSPCKQRWLRKCLPGPKDCGPASREPSAAEPPVSCLLPDRARRRRNWDAREVSSRIRPVRARVDVQVHPPIPLACTCRNRQSGWSTTGHRSGELRSEEHTSELQSHLNLVCRLLLEKKKKTCNQ